MQKTLLLQAAAVLFFLLAPQFPLRAQPATPPEAEAVEVAIPAAKAAAPTDITQLELENLLNIKITSVAKKEQTLLDAAAAVYVISQEDIRRSGATSIPELLRLVPGMDVARINGNTWAISVRGFNSRYANKLLVMIDGRSVYTPIYSGVFWDNQDLLLDDVERIEVIRGPGATLWGANAVNGVINVITKKATQTQGALATAGGGTKDRAFGGARYGGKIDEQLRYRLYTKYANRADQVMETYASNRDNSWDVRGGLRLDWQAGDADQVTLQGDLYSARTGQQGMVDLGSGPLIGYKDAVSGGGNVLLRWEHTLSAASDWTAQLYYDRVERDELMGKADINTVDLDFQHAFPLFSRQRVTWGAGYRMMRDDTAVGAILSFIPQQRTLNLFSGFVQDEVALWPEVLILTLGSKLEHNTFSGFEYQPSGRLLWKAHPNASLWAAVSRAVRTPSRIEKDILYNIMVVDSPGGQMLLQTVGNPDFLSETLMAYEGGVKVMPHTTLSFDITGFYNRYSNLQTQDARDPSLNPAPPPPLLQSFIFSNRAKAETYGVEGSSTWQVSPQLKLNFGYALLEADFTYPPDLFDSVAELKAFSKSQFHLRSYLDITKELQFDTLLYYTSKMSSVSIPGHTRLDFRLSWQPHPRLALCVALQDAFDNGRVEFSDNSTGLISSRMRRNIYGKITTTF